MELRNAIITRSSAVAEKQRCRVGQFWMGDGIGQTILCIKRCWWQKTKGIDHLHDKSILYEKTVTAFLSPSLGGFEALFNLGSLDFLLGIELFC